MLRCRVGELRDAKRNGESDRPRGGQQELHREAACAPRPIHFGSNPLRLVPLQPPRLSRRRLRPRDLLLVLDRHNGADPRRAAAALRRRRRRRSPPRGSPACLPRSLAVPPPQGGGLLLARHRRRALVEKR